jgi:DNA-binding response OmpR family regulator
MASQNERILVVESDPDISDLIARQALKPMGYQVTVLARLPQGFRRRFSRTQTWSSPI